MENLRVGHRPIFCICRTCRCFSHQKKWKYRRVKTSVELVKNLVEPAILALGLELWGIEHVLQGKYSLLRIYIESDRGISVEDCEKVSRQVSAILDVEGPITGEYTLEVSSPGLDRPLFTAGQFEQFLGNVVNVRIRTPIEGRRKFRGKIECVTDEVISLQVEQGNVQLGYSDIEKANIVFE